MNHSTPTPHFPDNLQDYAPWVAKYGLLQPYGKCQCGCGQDTRLSDKARPRAGHAKGAPQRFALGHRIFPQTPEETFWKYVTPGEQGECWMWTGSVSNRGYGKFIFNGVTYSAHRFSYEIHHGPIPEGQFACHKCDNPSCQNPDHLFAGTPLDNMRDKMAKGRGRWMQGEAHHKTKLTAAIVRDIRRLHTQGVSQQEIADKYGVRKNSISRIVNRVRWAHIT